VIKVFVASNLVSSRCYYSKNKSDTSTCGAGFMATPRGDETYLVLDLDMSSAGCSDPLSSESDVYA
jgi:hypothetical protein